MTQTGSEGQKPETALSSEPKPFILLASPRWQESLLAFGVLFLALLIFRFEAISRLTTHFLGGAERDAALYHWLALSNGYSFFSNPWFSTDAFYPYTQTLAWSDNFLLPSAAIRAFLALGASLPLAFNLVILGASVLNGYSTFLLTFSLSHALLPSLGAGLVFMCFSFLTAHLGHPQLQFAFLLPLGVLALFRFFAAPSRLRAAGLGFLVSVSFLTTVYYAIFLPLLYIVIALGFMLLRPRQILSRLYLTRLPFAGFGLLPAIPFVVPYLDVKSVFGARNLHEPYHFAATALSYFSASPFNTPYGFTSGLSHSEAHLFPGVLILTFACIGVYRAFGSAPLRRHAFGTAALLAGASAASIDDLSALGLPRDVRHLLCAGLSWLTLFSAAWLMRRLGRAELVRRCTFITNRDLLAISAFAAVTLYFVSFGPLGYLELGVPGLGVYRLFYELLPGFDSARAIGRLGVAVFLLLVLTAALGAAHYERTFRFPLWFSSIIILFAAIEHFHIRYPIEHPPSRPPIFERLEAIGRASPGAVLVLPFAGELTPQGQVRSWSEFARLHVNAMRWTQPSGLPLVNGYSGIRSKPMREWPARLSDFPGPRSLRALSEVAGLRYVVLLASRHQAPLLSFPGALRFIEADRQGNALFEYVGTRAVDVPGAVLLAPSFPAATLEMELSVLSQQGKESVSILIFGDSGSGPIELGRASLDGNGTWKTIAVSLPESAHRTAPWKITFKVEDSTLPRKILYLRRSAYRER